MNIVCDGSSLRAIKYNATHTYSLDVLTFYISKKYQKYKFFVIVRSGSRMEAIGLKQVNSTNKDYFNYICSDDYPTRFEAGTCELSLLGINPQNASDHFTTETLSINLDNAIYNFKAQIRTVEEMSQRNASLFVQMEELYQKVVNLTELNIQMLNDQES